jgi:hypothetical protein
MDGKPTPHVADDPIPLLPRGTPLFELIAAPAIVIEALGPTVGDGMVLVRAPGCLGVILVADGELLEEYSFETGVRLHGGEALGRIASWQDATVSAYRFDRVVVSVAPVLLRGRLSYEDLHLKWTDWRALLAELRHRSGLIAVEVDTPTGRGVTLIGAGRQLATYTDAHPEPGDDALLDPLAATGEGTIRVRHEPGGGVPAIEAFPDPGTSAAAESTYHAGPAKPDRPTGRATATETAEATGAAGPADGSDPGARSEDPGMSVAEPERPEPAAATAGEMATTTTSPPTVRSSWWELWWRHRRRQVTLVAGSVLVLTGLGLTAPALIQQATVQQAVAARGANDVNAVNSWLAGSASPGRSSAEASPASTAPGAASTCGGTGSETDAYALVEFSGLPQYGYVGVAVDGNWTRLDDRSTVHWYGSPAPGGEGNVIFAFHREPDYQYIDQLGVGETVTIEDRSCQIYVYTITQRWQLDPSLVTQLDPTGGHELTLITCTPWWQDYDRLVWRADLTSVNGVPVAASS